jgi:DUF1680 family protein
MKISSLPTLAALIVLLAAAPAAQARHVAKSEVSRIQLGGYIGHRIDGCIAKRVETQNTDELTGVFRHQNEVRNLWGSEFWGKWVQGAIASYRYCRDPRLLELIRSSVEKIERCQLPDGYIGNYDKTRQLGGWDVWGRKYTLLGLIEWYRLTADRRALSAACRLLNYTMSQFPAGKKAVWQAGLYKGMPSMSILEPVVYMYRLTGNRRYLDFAQRIVDDGENGGPQLIAKQDVPVAERFPLSADDSWWSAANGQKAYEMMSCYVGMLELAKVTSHKEYLGIVEKVYRHILREEINICGSGSAYECWYGGAARQTRATRHAMETCVTFTWMQLNEKLLEMTDNPLYADQLERTVCNALMAALRGDNGQIAKYIPLEGFRHEGEDQCGLHINCCNANGPRAFAMIPRVACRVTAQGRAQVNLYLPFTAWLTAGGHSVKLTQQTEYPADSVVTLSVDPEKTEARFALQLRIPAWSTATTVRVNGQRVEGVRAGTYLTLDRTWQKGDRVSLTFDMSARISERDHCMAIERGPVVLARDSRFADGFVDESLLPAASAGRIVLKPVPAPEGVWMAFEMQALTGTYAESAADARSVRLCDFASAGNSWNPQQRYRVWLPKTLNVQTERAR